MDLKSWQERLPAVSEVRPGRCPGCHAASQPVGGALQLHGHGTRPRQLWGPPVAGGPPVMVEVMGRRYRCLACGAVTVVVPRSVLAGRRYSASAIAYALALWGLALATAATVRRRVNPARLVGDAAAGTWASLRRWARAVRERRLFPTVPLPAADATWREVAAAAAAGLAGLAGPASRAWPIDERAFAGGARAVR